MGVITKYKTPGLATLNKIHFDLLSSYWGLSELRNGLFPGSTGISVYFLIIVLNDTTLSTSRWNF